MKKVFQNRNVRVKEMALYEKIDKVKFDPELRKLNIKTKFEHGVFKI